MQKVCSFALAILLVAILLALPATGRAQSAGELQVADATVCRSVENREAVDSGTSFPVSVEKLSFLTRITGAENPTKVTHVWFRGDEERFRLELAVNSVNWRTFSTKNIRPGDVGSWRVEVFDSAGTVLKTVPFEVTP